MDKLRRCADPESRSFESQFYTKLNEIENRNLDTKAEMTDLLYDLAVDTPEFILALDRAEKGHVLSENNRYLEEDESGEEIPAWIIYSEDLNPKQESLIRNLLKLPLGIREQFEEGISGSEFDFTSETGIKATSYMLVDIYMEHREELNRIAINSVHWHTGINRRTT